MCIWCDKDPYTGNVTSRTCEEEVCAAKPLELSLDSTIKDIVNFMSKKQCNPLVINFKNLGAPSHMMKISIVNEEVE